jgi:hypothetical protein
MVSSSSSRRDGREPTPGEPITPPEQVLGGAAVEEEKKACWPKMSCRYIGLALCKHEQCVAPCHNVELYWRAPAIVFLAPRKTSREREREKCHKNNPIASLGKEEEILGGRSMVQFGTFSSDGISSRN